MEVATRMSELLAGESAWLIGFLVGMAVGIALCRWLWINGAKASRRNHPAGKDRNVPSD